MKQTIALCMLLFAFAFVGCKSNHVALNDIQVIGSHNSYKIAIENRFTEFRIGCFL